MASFARLTLAAVGLLACSAQAFAPGNISYPGGNRAIISPAALQGQVNSIITNASQNAKIVDEWITRIGGKNVPVQTSRTATARQIARGLAGATGVGALAIALQIAAEYRCRANAAGDWSCDNGTPPKNQPGVTGQCFGTVSGEDAGFAYDQCLSRWEAHMRRTVSAVSVSRSGSASCSATDCTGVSINYSYYTDNYGQQVIVHGSTGVIGLQVQAVEAVPTCKAPAVMMPNGLCTQPETEWAPKTDDEVATKIEPLVKADPAERLRDALRSGGKVETGPVTSSTGPQTVVQDPTTKVVTSPTGQPLTTTTTVTNHITYQGDTITWNDTKVTVNPDGSTEAEEAPPKEEKSPCEVNPDSIDCQERDTPDAGDIEKKDIPVSYSPDSGWAEAGSCPPDVQLSLLGQSFAVEYTPTCNFLVGMRPFVIAAASMVALLIFIGGLKE